MYPYQHDAERRMTEAVNQFQVSGFKFQVERSPGTAGESIQSETLNLKHETRLLNQMARELLLAESSDWAFQIYQGTTVEYSSRRFQSHIQRFDLLANMLETGEVNEELLAEIERRDNIFSEISFQQYAS
jgi:1,4-alpha-glucan branching enzyme